MSSIEPPPIASASDTAPAAHPEPPGWIRPAIETMSIVCFSLAGLVVLALLLRSEGNSSRLVADPAPHPAEPAVAPVGSDDDVPYLSMSSAAAEDTPTSSASSDDGSANMSAGPEDAVSARILKQVDASDWAEGERPAAADSVEPPRKPGSDWLPRPARFAGQREPAGVVAAAIDAQIDARLQTAGISAAGPADDAEFVRRIYLDLHGRIPTYEQTVWFLGDTRADKRARLIDALLARPEFGFRLAHYWRDLLLKRDPDRGGLPNEPVFVSWFARQINRGTAWDGIVRAMLTADGDEALAGQTFFILACEDDKQPAPNKLVASTAALFMGIQLQCAECHTHPTVEHWKPADFWGLAAFFAGTHAERRDAAKGKQGIAGTAQVSQRTTGRNAANGQIAIPDPKNDGRTIGIARARLFEHDGAAIDAPAAQRQTVADWLASTDDPYFAPAAVNRIWSILMARGLVEPLDDMRPDNLPTHPELLALLTTEFVAAEFDLKHLVRSICNSQAYQRTSRPPSVHDDADRLYAHATIKVLSADMLFDSLAIATGGRFTRSGVHSGGKSAPPSPYTAASAVEFYDQREYDELSGEYTYGIPQLLRLMNRQLLKACEELGQRDAPRIVNARAIERLYLTAYARRPTPAETQRIEAFARQSRAGNSAQAYGAALWALLNSAEFYCNH